MATLTLLSFRVPPARELHSCFILNLPPVPDPPIPDLLWPELSKSYVRRNKQLLSSLIVNKHKFAPEGAQEGPKENAERKTSKRNIKVKCFQSNIFKHFLSEGFA